MKGFYNRRYSKKQVIMMLTLAFTLVAGVSYAWNLTVPNTFSSGSTISSAAINSNFDFLESRLGAVRMYSGTSQSVTATYSAPAQLVTATFTAPQNGYFLIQGHAGFVELYRSSSACMPYGYVGIGINSTTGIYNYNLFQSYDTTTGTAYSEYHLNTQYLYGQVSMGTSVTVYLNAYSNTSTCTTGSFYVANPRLTVSFFPTIL